MKHLKGLSRWCIAAAHRTSQGWQEKLVGYRQHYSIYQSLKLFCVSSSPFVTWRHLISVLISHREKEVDWVIKLSTMSYLLWNLGETAKFTHHFQSRKAELKFFSAIFLFQVLTPNWKPLLYPLTRLSCEERNFPRASRLRKQMQSSISFGMESLNSVLLAEVYVAGL